MSPARFRPGSRVFRVTAGTLYTGRVFRVARGTAHVALTDGSTCTIDRDTAHRWGLTPAEARRRRAALVTRPPDPPCAMCGSTVGDAPGEDGNPRCIECGCY